MKGETVTVIDDDDVYTDVVVADPEPRELVPVGLSSPTPEGLVALATRMADALADIVEKKRLFATISGKKFPTVEAWMTIARMDNVVAREVGAQRREDGAYEATVELVRLTDGIRVGGASALCGTEGDKPWDSRPEFQVRSMAVTRATSRAFRQQYSWIMSLAGYEPTPAEEMIEEAPKAARPASRRAAHTPAEGPAVPWSEGTKRLEGRVVVTDKMPTDLLLREGRDGSFIGFRFDYRDAEGELRHIAQAVARGQLALDINDAIEGKPEALAGKTATIEGEIWMVPWDKDGRAMPAFARMDVAMLATEGWSLP